MWLKNPDLRNVEWPGWLGCEVQRPTASALCGLLGGRSLLAGEPGGSVKRTAVQEKNDQNGQGKDQA
jgi:hypothetical protein